MKKSYINISALSLALFMILQNSSYASLIKCWNNKNKIRECSSVVPPEYSRNRIEIVNDRGMIIKVIPAAKTEEELARERRIQLEQEEHEAELAEQARLDNILLNTYTTERDLILARTNNLQAIQSQIDVSKSNLALLVTNLERLQKKAGDYERNSKKPPKKLTNSIKQAKNEIAEMERYIAKKENDLAVMSARFDANLARFRILKSGGL